MNTPLYYPSITQYPSTTTFPAVGASPTTPQQIYNQTIEYLSTPALIPNKTYRIIAQKILTREFIDWDLPISDVSISYTLSGPNLIRGRLKPELQDFLDIDLEPKATFIHVEQDDIIRASGILQPGEIDNDGSISITAEGLSGYPHGQPFQGIYLEEDVDPVTVLHAIWDYLLSSPRVNLGITIGGSTSTPVRIGNEIDLVNDTIKPYTLFWWDNPDCGRAIDDLAKNTPFDYYEFSEWNTIKTDISHSIIAMYPRVGVRRFDLGFVSGENIISITLLREEPDQYASEVVVIGAGTGVDTVRGFASNVIGNRIRQAKAVTDKTIIDVSAANTRAQKELANSQALLQIREITILDTHDNASLGDFTIGDDILIQAEVYWIGNFSMWCRVMSYSWAPEKRTINVQLTNSDQFNYGIT